MKEMMISCRTFNLQEDLVKSGKDKDVDPVKPFALPDGTVIQVGSERTKAAEIMFKPSIIGFEEPGVHQMVLNSIKRADLNLRDQLYKNIVLSGGNSMIQNFQERLAKEVQNHIGKGSTQVAVCKQAKIHVANDRHLACWKGASILAGMSAMKGVWVNAKTYQDEGDRALLKFSF